MKRLSIVLVIVLLLLGGCASKSDLEKIERERKESNESMLELLGIMADLTTELQRQVQALQTQGSSMKAPLGCTGQVVVWDSFGGLGC